MVDDRACCCPLSVGKRLPATAYSTYSVRVKCAGSVGLLWLVGSLLSSPSYSYCRLLLLPAHITSPPLFQLEKLRIIGSLGVS